MDRSAEVQYFKQAGHRPSPVWRFTMKTVTRNIVSPRTQKANGPRGDLDGLSYFVEENWLLYVIGAALTAGIFVWRD